MLRNSNWRARVFRPAVARCRDTDDTFPPSHRTIYADLFDEDLDEVADRVNDAMQVTADALRTAQIP